MTLREVGDETEAISLPGRIFLSERGLGIREREDRMAVESFLIGSEFSWETAIVRVACERSLGRMERYAWVHV
jgi:hypothetical protein